MSASEDTKITGAASFPLSAAQLSVWRSQFYEQPLNCLAQNICTARDPVIVCLKSPAELFTELQPSQTRNELTLTGKPTSGGPGWICSGLDILRHIFNQKFHLSDFELSAGHLLYWHKLERCNYFLYVVAELLERCEPLDGRNFRYLMKHSVPDGGNWQMFVNLVKKYGVMPKKCYLTNPTAPRLRQLNKILRSKLHEYASLMHAQFTFDGDASNLNTLISRMLPQLYKVITICLGEPPVEFTWTYYNSKKRFQSLENLTALNFYQEFIKPDFDRNSYVCLGHDPRLSSAYHRNYHIAHSSNMVEGLRQSYNNQPMDIIMDAILASLSACQPVWLGCDLQTRFTANTNVLSLSAYNFDQIFGLPLRTVLTKAERMLYKETRRDAALLITAVSLDAEQQPLQFRTNNLTAADTVPSSISLHDNDEKLEQSQTGKRSVASRKAAIIEANWLREFAFEVVVHSKFVPPAVMYSIENQNSTELHSWDVMGAFLS